MFFIWQFCYVAIFSRLWAVSLNVHWELWTTILWDKSHTEISTSYRSVGDYGIRRDRTHRDCINPQKSPAKFCATCPPPWKLKAQTSWANFILLLLSSCQEWFSRLLEGQPKLFFRCWLPFVPFSAKMIPHCFNDVEVQALGRFRPSIRPVATNGQVQKLD